MGDTENVLSKSTGFPLIGTEAFFDQSMVSFHPVYFVKLGPCR